MDCGNLAPKVSYQGNDRFSHLNVIAGPVKLAFPPEINPLEAKVHEVQVDWTSCRAQSPDEDTDYVENRHPSCPQPGECNGQKTYRRSLRLVP